MTNRFHDATSIDDLMRLAIGFGSTCWRSEGKTRTFDSAEALAGAEDASRRMREILHGERGMSVAPSSVPDMPDLMAKETLARLAQERQEMISRLNREIGELRNQLATRNLVIDGIRHMVFGAWRLTNSFEKDEEDRADERG